MPAVLVTLLVILLIIAVVWCGFWMVNEIGLPHPLNMVAKAVVAIIGLYLLFMQVSGSGLLT